MSVNFLVQHDLGIVYAQLLEHGPVKDTGHSSLVELNPPNLAVLLLLLLVSQGALVIEEERVLCDEAGAEEHGRLVGVVGVLA